MTGTLVMKFGGASVATPESFGSIAKIILERKQTFDQIAVVISAMGNMTDELQELATQVNPDPPKRELDMLLSVGERISMSLLAMALAKEGVEAVSFTGSQSGIITSADHTEAQIIGVRPIRLETPLSQGKIVIVAGFQGVSESKEITTLGRGGSDTTAVALGAALGAQRVEFYKDVGGIFSEDPQINPDAKLLSKLSYIEALKLAQGSSRPVLHPRAIEMAEDRKIPLQIRSFAQADTVGTAVFELNPSPC